MIRSLADEDTRQLWLTGRSRKLGNIARVALRKLQILSFAIRVDDLNSPRGNRLEKLRGDREGQYSIRINDQYRICFRWEDKYAVDIEITDYH
jgi:proteic killer suppression protein